MNASSARRAEFAAFLRAHRARLRPQDVGLPADAVPGRRRTPGLRREEVAQLSGVGVTWYTWLEQGRPATASPQVVDALAQALRLDPTEHQHLRALAGLTSQPPETGLGAARPRLQRLVDAAAPNVAVVYDAYLDYVVWNTPYRLVRHDPGEMPERSRNLLWMMFADQGARSRLARWEPAARAVLGQFRAAAGRRPADPRVARMVADLSGISPQFRTWWQEYPVRSFVPATVTVEHPIAGRLRLDMFQFRPVEYPDLLMVLQVPATADDLERLQILL